jgi:two-component system OmpR family sensor kinase
MFEISLLDLSATFAAQASATLDVAFAVVADACAANAVRRGVRLDVPTIAPTPVAIDGDRLALVLVNLVENAVKHGRAAGYVRVSVELGHPRAVAIAVDDDGPGIPAALRERIFALGERGTTGADGTGIGLALARMIVERAGGRIEAAESPLGGARFVLTIPRSEER